MTVRSVMQHMLQLSGADLLPHIYFVHGQLAILPSISAQKDYVSGSTLKEVWGSSLEDRHLLWEQDNAGSIPVFPTNVPIVQTGERPTDKRPNVRSQGPRPIPDSAQQRPPPRRGPFCIQYLVAELLLSLLHQ